MAQVQQRYFTAMKYTHLRMLRENFRSWIFRPALVSIAGVLMKPRATHIGHYKSRLNSDVVSVSARGARDSGCIFGGKFVSALQISLLWRTPWTYGTFARAYGSAFELTNTQREIRGSDQDDDDVDGEEHIEDDDNVEDEQYIEDDDDDEEEDEEDEESHVMQSQGPVKKKIQPKPPKSKATDRESQPLNENITAKIIRLVNDGEGHRIVSREEALALAKDKNMDLVLVDVRSNPPVCKIFDFHKEEYRQEQIKKERRKKQGKLNEMKQLRFNTKTEPKDLKMKVDKAKKFMDRGYRVKFVANLKGSFDDEKKKQEQEKMINAIYSLVEDIAVIEQGPRLETQHAWLVLRHVKFGQNKKKTPKNKLKIGATEQVDNMKDEVELHGKSDDSEGHEEKNSEPVQSSFPAIPELNTTSVWGTSPVGRSQGYPSEVAGSSMQPSTLWNEVGRSPVQPPPPRDPDGLRTLIQPPPPAFPQHTPSLQGLGGLRGLETSVAPPRGSPPGATPMRRGAGVQGGRLQVLPPSGSSLHEAGQSHLQTPQDSDEGLKSQMKPLPRAFPQHTPSLPGFGGLRGFETPASAPRGPSLSTPILQDAGVQGPRRQVSAPGGSPLFNVHDADHSHADHSYLQPPPSQDPYEGLLSGIQPAPPRGFSQLNGFGGLRNSGMPVSPPCGPVLSTPTLQGFGAQSSRMFSPPQHPQETGHSCAQPIPRQVSDEGLMFGMHSSPPRGFPQHTPSLRGFGGLRGSETLVPPARGPPPSTPTLQGPGIQDSRMLFPPPGPVQAPEVGHSYLQPPPPRDPDEGLRSGMQPPPARGHTSFLQGFGGSRGSETPLSSPRGFPQHTPFLQGFGGQRGSETQVSPPPGPQSFTPMPQGAGVQGPRMQVAPPRGFPPHRADHPHMQPPPLLDLDGFRSPGVQRPPSHAYPQQTTSSQEFGGLRGSETLVSPPRAPPTFTPRLQGAGVQGPRMQGSPPGSFPLRAHEASHSHGLPPPARDSDGGMQLPRRGFPGFAGVGASEAYGFQRDGQGYQQNQASQGYPPQRGFPQTRPAQEAHSPGGDGQILPQSRASQGYPLQTGFLQTRPAQEAYSPPGDGQFLPQSQASQGYALQRGFLQTRPVAPPVPPPPGYRSWSKPPPQSQEYAPSFEPPGYRSWSKPPPQSQEYAPLFEPPSEKT